MKTNKLMVSFVTMIVAILAISTVMAATVSFTDVLVSDVDNSVVGTPGESVPVEVRFNSDESLDDVKLQVWISGYKNDIEASTGRFNVLANKTYVKKFTLDLPNVEDLDDLNEDLTLHVELSDKNNDYRDSYTITVQRESYTYDLLSVEAPSSASAGEMIAIDVVLKNIGTEELEDSFVIAKISELGLYKKVYFGDIAAEDNADNDDDAEDARERRIYLVVPADALSGDYDLEVKASNYDAASTVVETISINGLTVEDSVIDTTDNDNGISNSVIVLTVVLVIIFLVLLIVLIVLLTKKPTERIEDFGETSYY